MQSIIKQILQNEIAYRKLTDAEQAALEKVVDNDEALTKMLQSNPEALKAYTDFKDAIGDEHALENLEFNKQAFILAFRLATEIWND